MHRLLTDPAIPLADSRGGVALCHGCQHRITFAGGYLAYLTKVLNAEIKLAHSFRLFAERVTNLNEGEACRAWKIDKLDRYRQIVRRISGERDITLRLQTKDGFVTVTHIPAIAIEARSDETPQAVQPDRAKARADRHRQNTTTGEQP